VAERSWIKELLIVVVCAVGCVLGIAALLFALFLAKLAISGVPS
jgi:hypothetical protein